MKNDFKPIPGYKGHYTINTDGIIFRPYREDVDKRGRKKVFNEMFMEISIDRRSGYLVCNLTKPGASSGTQYVHRLCALTHLNNLLNKEVVNHKNGKKTDATIENLEWNTRSENHRHAILNKLCTPYAKTPILNQCTGHVYPSIKEAAIATNMEYKDCISLLNGIINTFQCLQRIIAIKQAA